MTMTFKRATRSQARLRLGLIGPAGSGKTMTALRIASGLGGKIAVVDTERGSASLYMGERDMEFDVIELDSYEVENFIEAINAAAAGGYSTLIIDSLSHAWAGKGGILEFVVLDTEHEFAEAVADDLLRGSDPAVTFGWVAAAGGDAQRDGGLVGGDADEWVSTPQDEVGKHRLDRTFAGTETLDATLDDRGRLGQARG